MASILYSAREWILIHRYRYVLYVCDKNAANFTSLRSLRCLPAIQQFQESPTRFPRFGCLRSAPKGSELRVLKKTIEKIRSEPWKLHICVVHPSIHPSIHPQSARNTSFAGKVSSARTRTYAHVVHCGATCRVAAEGADPVVSAAPGGIGGV